MRFPSLLARLGLTVGAAAGVGACGSDGPNLPQGSGVRLAEVASGLSSPLYLTSPPGDVNRLFIVEKTGAIRIVKDGTLLPTPFLDISGQVSGGAECVGGNRCDQTGLRLPALEYDHHQGCSVTGG